MQRGDVQSWADYSGGFSFLAWPQTLGQIGTFADTDPDPAHLVGTSTFSDAPSDATFDRTRSITFTYDLRLR